MENCVTNTIRDEGKAKTRLPALLNDDEFLMKKWIQLFCGLHLVFHLDHLSSQAIISYCIQFPLKSYFHGLQSPMWIRRSNRFKNSGYKYFFYRYQITQPMQMSKASYAVFTAPYIHSASNIHTFTKMNWSWKNEFWPYSDFSCDYGHK